MQSQYKDMTSSIYKRSIYEKIRGDNNHSNLSNNMSVTGQLLPTNGQVSGSFKLNMPQIDTDFMDSSQAVDYK